MHHEKFYLIQQKKDNPHTVLTPKNIANQLNSHLVYVSWNTLPLSFIVLTTF